MTFKPLIFENFWGPPLTQFSKFNNFLWVCWFLGKNLSNFVPPVWKLHNPYCHNMYYAIHKDWYIEDLINVEYWIYSMRQWMIKISRYDFHRSLECTFLKWLECLTQNFNLEQSLSYKFLHTKTYIPLSISMYRRWFTLPLNFGDCVL